MKRHALAGLVGAVMLALVTVTAAHATFGPRDVVGVHRAKPCKPRCVTAPASTAPVSTATPTPTPPPTSAAPTTTAPTPSAPTTAPTSSAPTTAPTTAPTPTATATPIDPMPAQPGGIFYGDPGTQDGNLAQYAHPGAMVIAGRGNYGDQGFKQVEAAGGTVLIYLDAIVHNTTGPYHRLLFNASTCGPAVPEWPGPIPANSTGNLADFRVGGILQGKLACVLEQIVADNPGAGGFFMDDLGSRSWFPNLNWPTFTAKQAYYDGAVAIAQTTRQVADEHGLIYLVNGTWERTTTNGGGYPDVNVDGLSLADGGVVEHHDGQSAFFGPYGCGAQWATASQTTHGQQFMFDISSSSAGVTEYTGTGCFAWIANQTSAQYDGTPPYSTTRWHPNGL